MWMLVSAPSEICGWAGYKVHLTETCDDETPHLITHVETTPATTYDGAMMETIHAALAEKGLRPAEHVVDSGYLDAEVLVSSQEDHAITLIGPVAVDNSWQAKAEQGFAVTHFTIDWVQQQVVCPTGNTSRLWINTHDRHGKDVIHIKFNPADCQACPCRSLYEGKIGSTRADLTPAASALSGTAEGTRAPNDSNIQKRICTTCWDRRDDCTRSS